MLVLLIAGLLVSGAGIPGRFSPVAVASSQATSDQDDLGGVLRGMENRYNRLKSIRLHFEQVYRQGRQRVITRTVVPGLEIL